MTLLLLLLALLVPNTVYATYYWASPTGSSSPTCTAIDSASVGTDPGSYGTIGGAARCATVAGDVVVVKAGTYTKSDDRIDTANAGNIDPGQFVSGTSESTRTMIIGNPAGARPKINRPSFYCTYTTVERHWITLKYLELDSMGSAGCSQNVVVVGQHVRLDDVWIHNVSVSGMQFTSGGSTDPSAAAFGEVINSKIYDVALSVGSGYCIYVGSSDVLIERTECYNSKGWGFHIYNGNTSLPPSRATIRHSYVHDVKPGTGDFCGGIVAYGVGHVVHNNVIALPSSACTTVSFTVGAIDFRNTGGSATVYNNTIQTQGGDGIKLSSTHGGSTIKNNIITEVRSGSLAVNALAGTNTITHNACTAAQTCGTTGKVSITGYTTCLVSIAGTLKSGANICVDSGANVGLPYNGSAPDIGAFETFVFSSCEVPNGAAGTIQLIFTSNANTLGSTLTTFTARLNGLNNALTGAASKIGDTIISLPLTTTYVGGDTADVSWSSGGLTDNARIGGSLNQPFLQTLTNQSCTNNSGGAPTYTLDVLNYRFKGVYGDEASTDWRGDENVSNFNVVKGGAVRIRLAVKDTIANAPPFGVQLYYKRDGGTETIVPSSPGDDGVAMCETFYVNIGVVSGGVTTNQLSTAGTFIPGAVVLSSLAVPTITGLDIGFKTETEYCVRWTADASGVFTFLLFEQTGRAVGSTAIPTITIIPMQANGGT